jgi:uncharacterized GH25 family protein
MSLSEALHMVNQRKRPGLSLLAGASLLFLSVGAISVLAHECWIQPKLFSPCLHSPTPVSLMLGIGFPGESRARNDARIVRFELYGPDASAAPTNIGGLNGEKPAGSFTIDAAGVHVIAYQSRPVIVELEGEEFDGYLDEQGLAGAAKERKDRGESGKPAKEAYSRCAKALVCASKPAQSGWERRAGLEIEIVPLNNPLDPDQKAELRFQVLVEGVASPGAQILFQHQESGGSSARIKAVTDGNGEARVTLPQPGIWMLNTVHMRRAVSRTDVAWESVWSSLTFDLPQHAAGQSAAPK